MRRELGRFGPQGRIGEIAEAWPLAVGTEIARNAWPARFRRDGTLVVHARDSVWAFELTQRAGEIGARLDGVAALAFVPGPLPETAVSPPPAAPEPLRPSPDDAAEAARLAAAIGSETLRATVARAIERALARGAHDRPF